MATPFKKDIFGPPDALTRTTHENPNYHQIGESMPVPTVVRNLGAVASVGASAVAAREDHVHPITGTAKGILARVVQATDQAVGTSATAITGCNVGALILPGHWASLHVLMAINNSAGGTVRVIFSWNGVVVYTADMVVFGVNTTAHFCTPPLILTSGLLAFTATAQASAGTANIAGSSFQVSVFWVTDEGG